MNFINKNAEQGIFLAPKEKLILNPAHDHIKQIDLNWLRWLISNESELEFYSKPPWQKMRTYINELNHYECQRCKFNHTLTILRPELGEHSKPYVHHIAELKLYPELAMHEDNLITLCWRCHELVHNRIYQPKKQKPFTNFDASESW